MDTPGNDAIHNEQTKYGENTRNQWITKLYNMQENINRMKE